MRALACLLLALPAAAQDRPRHNASFVPDNDDAVREMVRKAREAATKGKPETAADRLQAILLEAPPGLVALKGRELFAAPRRWAQIQLLAERAPFGPEVLKAWRAAYGRDADAGLRGAIAAGDEAEILRLLDRYPAAPAAPAALLALVDRALQRGDRDAARGLLLRVPEHAARSEEAALLQSAPCRRRAEHLRNLPVRRPAAWPTLGGDASRARNGDALPGVLEMLWWTPFLDEPPAVFEFESALEGKVHSPILPFYPVFDTEHIYVHLGVSVAILDRASGKLLHFAPTGVPASVPHVESMLLSSPGRRAATVDKGVLYFNRVLLADMDDALLPKNELMAYDVKARRVRWRVRQSGRAAHDVLRKPVFFRGAPALLDGRLYVYAAVRETADSGPTRKEEAFLFCFDQERGNYLWHRFLGYGDTEAAAELPPLSGLAPAVASGVVVAASGLGVAAGLDAASGEILWLLRYDRQPVRERDRLAEWVERKAHVGSAWFREAPRIAGDSVYFAPFDGDDMYRCWLRGRRDPEQGIHDVVQWNKGRTTRHFHSLLESCAGIAGDWIYYVGRRDEHHNREWYQTVVANRLDTERRLAYASIPAGERDDATGVGIHPEVFGRPTIAGSVVLVPTRRALFRFDTRLARDRGKKGGEHFLQVPFLPPFLPPAPETEEEEEPPPQFGTLVSLGGRLYAVTVDRIICYGAK